MINEIIFLAFGWILWCFSHSFLIHPPVADRLKKILGKRVGYFRLIYNVWAILSLSPLVVWTERISSPDFVVWSWPWTLLQAFLWACALGLSIAGLRAYDMIDFLGLSVFSFGKKRINFDHHGEFVHSGIHRWCRHPWYLSGFIVLWARNLAPQDLVVNFILCAYLVLGTHLEEVKLQNEFGDAYRHYRETVPMFFPVRGLFIVLKEWFRKKSSM